MQVLLPVDGSEFSQTAVREVARRPWPQGSTVRVMHVIPTQMLTGIAYAPPAPALAAGAGSANWPPVLLETYKAISESAERLVDGIAESLRQAGLAVDTAIREGDARHEIVEEANAWPADLIVIGSHGYSGIKRWLLGSVAQSVVSHAPCSVEVVRKREAG
jgi:nucleotide-binding universal stress UspA family protein